MSTRAQTRNPFSFLASWLGGWSRLVLLVVVIIGIAGGLLWERQRHPPVPEGALQVGTSLVGNVRQTTFRYPGTAEQVRSFYQQALAQRGWRYCGTQETPHCTNLVSLVGGAGQQTDVYRRADDQDFQGSTIEIRTINSDNAQMYVTMFETQSK